MSELSEKPEVSELSEKAKETMRLQLMLLRPLRTFLSSQFTEGRIINRMFTRKNLERGSRESKSIFFERTPEYMYTLYSASVSSRRGSEGVKSTRSTCKAVNCYYVRQSGETNVP